MRARARACVCVCVCVRVYIHLCVFRHEFVQATLCWSCLFYPIYVFISTLTYWLFWKKNKVKSFKGC